MQPPRTMFTSRPKLRSLAKGTAVAGALSSVGLLLTGVSLPGELVTRHDLDPQRSNQVPSASPLTWPRTTTAAPSSEQWHTATVVPATRTVGAKAQRCRVRRVEEWASIRCEGMKISAMTQLGGDSKGVSFHLDAPGSDRLPTEGVLVFPLRPGDRRVFSLWTLGDGYDGPLTVVAGVVVQAEWIDEAATLLLHDALVEPVRTAQGERRKQAAANPPTSTPSPPRTE